MSKTMNIEVISFENSNHEALIIYSPNLITSPPSYELVSICIKDIEGLQSDNNPFYRTIIHMKNGLPNFYTQLTKIQLEEYKKMIENNNVSL